ncbi:hypothetical protein [Noviherbaspirillum pedocola]|uniref:Uncharacterized protein n=1 Tax=Noviherbaspirillum pedocola TaxID=2801341 RepID=A0A934SPP6_9BURK|nr:hypothetical protein [Noviherbaspirillum pedocola]MBK4733252.1 hypothetical protein [Noviherbaspirillum pedocola]
MELFSTMQTAAMSQASVAADQIAAAVERCSNLREAIDRLRGRNDAVGLPVDAKGIRDALAHRQSLDAVFGADPSSLAGNLADAQLLAESLKRGGLDVQTALCYPVLVRTTVDGKSSERLTWMSNAERAQLDQLALPDSAELPGCPTRQRSDKDGRLTVYCCLDAYATVRLVGTSVPQVLQQAATSLQAAGGEVRRMVSELARANSKNVTASEDILALLKTLAKKFEQRIEKLHEERSEMTLENPPWQNYRQRLQIIREHEQRRAIEKQIEQRRERREGR